MVLTKDRVRKSFNRDNVGNVGLVRRVEDIK
jgi:hypothetical protein